MYEYDVPLSIDNLIDFEFLKRLHKVAISNMHGYIPYWGEELVSKKFEQFENDGLIKICDNHEALQCLKVPELKEILRTFNLKLTGNKQALINRIKENVPKEKISIPDEYTQSIIRTDFGEEIYNKLLYLKEKELNNIVDDMVESIKSSDFDKVNEVMCKYELKQPFQRGLFVGIGNNKSKKNKYGIDVTYWTNHLQKGFESDEIEVYQEALQECSWGIIEILYICLSVMLGMSHDKTISQIKRYFERHNLIFNEGEISKHKNFTKKVYTRITLKQLMNSNISRYKILGCNENSCSMCSRMNGKIFYVSEATEGVNLPPFCDGCKCTIVAEF